MSQALQEQLARMILPQKRNQTVSGIVSSVDEEKGTLVLKRNGYTDIVGVRIDAVKVENSRVSVIPKIGSAVVIAQIDEIEEYVMMKTSEVAKVQWKINGFEFEVNQKGLLKIKKGEDDFLTQMLELVKIINGIVVVQGKGPDRLKLEQVKNKLENIFSS